ncbi:hypothetical protein KAR91_23360 [Candidatus Pacearchaeota archaeon]|nr:hypothetical protein [Candidatus Pacearchaeota archaeon]
MKSSIAKIWLNDIRPPTSVIPEPLVEIRLDWSNDRHHAATVKWPCGKEEVADALDALIQLIRRDKHLD